MTINWCSNVLRHCQHSIGYMGDDHDIEVLF